MCCFRSPKEWPFQHLKRLFIETWQQETFWLTQTETIHSRVIYKDIYEVIAHRHYYNLYVISYIVDSIETFDPFLQLQISGNVKLPISDSLEISWLTTCMNAKQMANFQYGKNLILFCKHKVLWIIFVFIIQNFIINN